MTKYFRLYFETECLHHTSLADLEGKVDQHNKKKTPMHPSFRTRRHRLPTRHRHCETLICRLVIDKNEVLGSSSAARKFTKPDRQTYMMHDRTSTPNFSPVILPSAEHSLRYSAYLTSIPDGHLILSSSLLLPCWEHSVTREQIS